MTGYAVGSLVAARGREWVVLPDSSDEFLVLRPLGGGDDDVAGVLPGIEPVTAASFPPPHPDDLGDQLSAGLLRTALRIGFHSSAGPFRSLASLAVEPRPYQLVPLLMALRLDPVRLLIADDVGIGKTIEAALVAAELLAQGTARGLAVLCSPALAEQWQGELRTKFGLDAELVLPGTVTRLQRGLTFGQSLFERYPHVVVSTDFIKSPRRRDDFVRACPDLVIVDEAHTCVAEGTGHGSGRTQRYQLLQHLARTPDRHLILVTATPHSGKEEGFQHLLGLLDPQLPRLDRAVVGNRERLARHLVQRRRRDIRRYLDEETPFPRDRLSREEPYTLSPAYHRLFAKVIGYARESVQDTTDGTVRQRVRWWSALSLLRALASSPRAAAQTLRTRANTVEAVSWEEADELGGAAVLDFADADALEAIDTTPGADPDAGESADTPLRRRLRQYAREADALTASDDTKLTTVTSVVQRLLADGYAPIVFCRFIDTAEYVAEQLAAALRGAAAVAAVTGTLPPSEREARIRTLADQAPRRVLVATDCLSEGVNLQDSFQAVIHYDLAWNPTRHEQREGRVDRFGQHADVVRAVTVYGTDNRIDGIVLDVLLRKHHAIRKATGVSVPVPDSSNTVVAAVLEGLLLRTGDVGEQLAFDGIATEHRDELHRDWDSAADRERLSQTKYAHAGIRPQEVAAELAATRNALGSGGEVAGFTRDALTELGATLLTTRDGFTASLAPLPIGLREALGPHPHDLLRFHTDLPQPRGEALLTRTDPTVEAIARYVLDAALDPTLPTRQRPARRCGVIRTTAVTTRTTLLLARFRFHLTLPSRGGERPLVAEDARILAFRGTPPALVWLTDAEAATLLAATAAANVPPDQARTFAATALDAVAQQTGDLDARADQLAGELLAAHRRVRDTAHARVRGIRVTAQKPVDILGVYVYLPVPQAPA